MVPVTLLYRQDTPLDGSAPCLLYGYGSYGISIPASFNTNCLSLVDRGFRLRHRPYSRRQGEGLCLV
jgi:oligopeptidase B